MKKSVQEIKRLLNKSEDSRLEFKLCRNKLGDSFWETYSAFSNTSGGIIILGVEEENSKAKNILGVNDHNKIINEIVNNANSLQKTSYNSLNDVYFIEIEKNIIVVIVEILCVDASNKPVYLKNNINKSYIRVGESDQLINNDLLKAYIINSKDTLDTELLQDTYSIDDINLDTVKKYREFLDNNTVDYSMDAQKFLEQLGVFRKDRNDRNKIKLTKGGLLFFGKLTSIKDLIPHFQLDYYEIDLNSENRWEDRVSSGDMQYLELNIFDFYLIVRDRFNKNIKDKFILDSEQNQRLPYKANLNESIREALVNSLMHAHYDINSPIVIKSYNSYLEFKNPGIMKISPAEFFNGGISKQVNEIISTLFRRAGFSEKAGTGGKKISDVSAKLKLRTPEIISTTDGCTNLRIWKKDLLSTLDLQGDDYSIMAYMIKNIVSTRKQISNDLKLSEYYTRLSLNNLIKLNYLEVYGKGKSTKYILSVSNDIGKESVLRNLIRNLDTL